MNNSVVRPRSNTCMFCNAWNFVLNVSFSLWSLPCCPSRLFLPVFSWVKYSSLHISHFLLYSPPFFHPSIPLSPQSRRQQDPSPGSNMANADVEHKMRWRQGKRGEENQGWKIIHFQFNHQEKESKQTCSCRLVVDHYFWFEQTKPLFECKKITSQIDWIESEQPWKRRTKRIKATDLGI